MEILLNTTAYTQSINTENYMEAQKITNNKKDNDSVLDTVALSTQHHLYPFVHTIYYTVDRSFWYSLY